MSVNKFIGIGNVTKAPEVRYMTNGEAVANLTIACNEKWKNKAGDKQESVEFINLVFYRRLAEIAGQYLKKGSQVYIEGSLRTRKWQDKEGQERYTTEIRADQMKMLGSRQGGGEAPPAKESAPAHSGHTRPVGGYGAGSSGFSDMDDDIPFLFNMNTFCDTPGKPVSLWRARYGKGLSLLRANSTDF